MNGFFTMSPAQVITASGVGSTLRFHTWRRNFIKTQDVSQHVYGLLWLVLYLTGGGASRDLLVATLLHDAGEAWTGDMPGPTKARLGLTGALDAEEATALLRHLGVVAPELSVEEARVLDLADSLDGALFCLNESRLGNAHNSSAAFNSFLRSAKTKLRAFPSGSAVVEVAESLLSEIEAERTAQ